MRGTPGPAGRLAKDPREGFENVKAGTRLRDRVSGSRRSLAARDAKRRDPRRADRRRKILVWFMVSMLLFSVLVAMAEFFIAPSGA